MEVVALIILSLSQQQWMHKLFKEKSVPLPIIKIFFRQSRKQDIDLLDGVHVAGLKFSAVHLDAVLPHHVDVVEQ